ncbi:MAG: chorismate mutase [Thermaceae bacterium]|nr:chorismate mutase [Thermaceae bacterium]
MSLESVRREIDAVDARVVVLLAQRWRLVREAAKYKSTLREVEAKERVEQVVSNVRRQAEQQGLSPRVAELVYRILMSEFTALERREAGL